VPDLVNKFAPGQKKTKEKEKELEITEEDIAEKLK